MSVITCANPSSPGGGIPIFPNGGLAVTPSDTNTFATPVCIYVGVGGNVNVTPANGGSNVVFTGVPAGSVIPMMVLAVLSTNTTATNMVAIY